MPKDTVSCRDTITLYLFVDNNLNEIRENKVMDNLKHMLNMQNTYFHKVKSPKEMLSAHLCSSLCLHGRIRIKGKQTNRCMSPEVGYPKRALANGGAPNDLDDK